MSGRWLSVDPLSYLAPGWSPYNYAFNNPNKYIDPDGRFPIVLPALYIAGELLVSAAATVFVTVEVVNTVTNGSIYQDNVPVDNNMQMGKTDPKIVNGAQQGTKDYTQKNPAADKKADQDYKKSLKKQPNNGNNNGNKNSFKKGVKTGVVVKASTDLLDYAKDVIEEKRKAEEAAKKLKEQSDGIDDTEIKNR